MLQEVHKPVGTNIWSNSKRNYGGVNESMKPKKYETAKYTYKAMQLSSKLVAGAFNF